MPHAVLIRVRPDARFRGYDPVPTADVQLLRARIISGYVEGYHLKTALGQRPAISIYGTDYPTPDGSCIRDYIHVTDLATAHLLAIEHLQAGGEPRTYNLGSQHGFSVREVVAAAKRITGVDFPVVEAPRRSGDPAVLVASSAKFQQDFAWQMRYSDLPTILQTAWDWHRAFPDGYGG